MTIWNSAARQTSKINQGDGETVIEDIDIAVISHAEVFRGADAFQYSALTLPKQVNRADDRLSLEQSYTFNDFHFDQNAVYGENRLPGIPVHVYEAQLLYQTPSGFYAGPNLQCNFLRYPVDEANTLFADSYVLLGFRAGFRRPSGFSVFVDCRNLTNETYAAAVDVIADARAKQDPESFHPGDGRSFYSGVSWRW